MNNPITALDYYLRVKKNRITNWIIIGCVSALTIILLGIALGLCFGYTGISNYVVPTKVLGFLALGILFIPYLFLGGCWISGIENTSKTKTFQISLWTVTILALLFAALSLIIWCATYLN